MAKSVRIIRIIVGCFSGINRGLIKWSVPLLVVVVNDQGFHPIIKRIELRRITVVSMVRIFVWSKERVAVWLRIVY